MKFPPNDDCPCDSGKKYKKCCRPYHAGMKIPTPTDLVRARWSAYALELPDFIMQTTHPDNEEYDSNFAHWRGQIEVYCVQNTFYELEILSAEDNRVTYRSDILAVKVRPMTTTEDCVFEQVNGEWKYHSGEAKTIEHDRDEWLTARGEESEVKDR